MRTVALIDCNNSEARWCYQHQRASNHKPLHGITVMATNKHTEIQPQFTWRFMALNADSGKMIHIIATTERDARQMVPCGMVAIFMARLPVMEVAV